MVVYKIVKNDLRSILADVQYKIDTWVHTPKQYADLGLYLTCFTNLERAKEFRRTILSMSSSKVIYEAEARKVFVPTTRRSVQAVRRWWVHRVDLNHYWPNGTMMCKAIKLKKEI